MNSLKTPSAGQRIIQRGVSLIELMVSITIGVVMLSAILAIFSATSSTGKQSEAATRMSEDAAIAMNYMAGYIRMAGYSNPRVNVSESSARFGGSSAGNTDSNFSGAGIFGCDTGFANPTVAPAANSSIVLTCNAATATSTAAISVRFEGDIYNTGSATTPTDCLGQAVAATTASGYVPDTGVVTNYALVESRFYVRTGTSSGVSELYCGGNGGGSNFAAQPIMQYVESMSFIYGVAEDGTSRTAARYLTQAQLDTAAAAAGVNVEARWKQVVSVKICMLMRSELPDQNGAGSYVDCSGATVAAPDRFIRRAFRSVVTLRNKGGIA
ncbi:MAG: PilW family protein [Pseudomonadota bacterium]